MHRTFWTLGCVFGFLAVAAGAFGAHALRARLGAEMLAASAFGLGWVIFDAKEFLNADIMLASLAVIGAIGYAFERLVFANKFGYPQGILTRIGDSRDVPSLWWLDPEKSRKYDEAMKTPSINLGEGASDDKYWIEYGKRTGQPQSGQ